MSTFEETFQEEAVELLVQLETALLELEDHPDDTESVDQAFRAMHTIKGSGAMFGFDKLSAFTHHLENAFDLVRSGDLQITKELISISLGSSDHIRKLLGEIDPSPGLEVEGDELLDKLAKLIPGYGKEVAVETETPIQQESKDSAASQTTYRIRMTPSVNTLVSGLDPLLILRELAALGSCRTTTLDSAVPSLSELDTESCHLAWDLILTSHQDKNLVEDVFIFVQDDWDLSIELIDQDSAWIDPQDEKTVGEILVERGEITSQEIEQALSQQKRTGEILTEVGKVTPEKVRAALAEQETVRNAHNKRKTKENTVNVKVPADKLDGLMDLVGELVIAQERLKESAGSLVDMELSSVAEEIERLTTDLRDNTLSLRMLPIGTTFARFRRLVRDLANDLDKEIDLVTEGAETELDKTVIDSLGDPLVHLIRNCIDHGIELPQLREKAGKPRKGTVHLSAVHSESHVVIKIKDDGSGLDAEAIRAKAIERGMLTAESEVTAQELYNLIFDAGFSTAKTVSSVSGRGVGMDVVRRSIESLRGKVWVESEPGQGSTVTVELPLTLAIIEGLLVKVGVDRYVLPLSLVEECIEVTREESQQRNGSQLIQVRGELVPFVRLREWFGQQDEELPIEQIVVTRMGDARFGFTVDEVIGQHQTVIKSLGKLYEGVSGLSGATILGDGSVALILDAPKVVQTVMPERALVH
ncbi:MAG: chemotaxis protein CheA [Gammaproteobacteria bacterium]|nr:chemotaxis protein CheA [Gammaproteobacteria bacterium]